MGEVKAASSPVVGQVVTRWLCDVLLIGVLLLGAYFRFTGLDWDQNQHLHPDERFLTMVETAIEPVKSLGEYFDTDHSTLNPNNRGFGFYVYGTLPLFAVRYAGEWLGKTGYDEIHLVGRQFSAVMDLGVVLLVYLIAARLYRSRPLALLASAFAAFSVLPIQLSHYFTVDTFTNFFGMLTLLSAVYLLPDHDRDGQVEAGNKGPGSLFLYILFGLALGLSVASKVNAGLLALLLPGAVAIRYFRQSKEERQRLELPYIGLMILAALISLLVFRIFQPYAFTGPGFFDVKPNQGWVDSLRSLAQQSTGDVDFPPALQWARRPITFAFTNMVLWGLGLPLGILAWSGFLWMGYRIARGEWHRHLLVWTWTGVYFTYQAFSFVRSMRYQMLVYPTLAIIAAWAVFALWQRGRAAREAGARRASWLRAGAVLAGVGVVALTAAWAFAFTRIYNRPVTRVEASRWIYQNIPGPINLHINTENGITNQPVAFRSGYVLRSGQPLVMAFQPRRAGRVATVTFERLGNAGGDNGFKIVTFSLSATPDGAAPFATGYVEDTFQPEDDPRGKTYTAIFDRMIPVEAGQIYYLVVAITNDGQSLNVAGSANLSIQTENGMITQALPDPVDALQAGKWYQMSFTPARPGSLSEVVLEHVVDWENRPDLKTLRVSIFDMDNGQQVVRTVETQSPFAPDSDVRGQRYTFRLPQPLDLRKGGNYAIRLEQVSGPGALAFYGSKQANESSWDDALPVSLDGYNPYDYYQGVYRSDLNFEMYWDDNADKLRRFLSILDQADTLFISSNRQWGTTTRVPERYPLTSEYYRQLLGCPVEREITWCYSVAEPGMFNGSLGFELTAVFQSDPNLGSLRFNSQFAEEAFTVYDAPKVLIFRKTAVYDPDQVQAILSAVDLSTVMHITPRKAGSNPANLLLPKDRLERQRAGGTWNELFSPDALFNRVPLLAALLWYVAISLMGWVVYPFTRLALRGLPDRGFPFIRLVGMLALAYPVWLLGSYGVPFTSVTVTLVFAALLLANLLLGFRDRKVLLAELRERRKILLTMELLFLAFFTLFLLVRLGNGDLWHPWKGGEKPMDFSYFNAVLKSTSFPPYDPWFAGGYINYYYYGFVIVGVPVKWLGITPSVAYNLILPTLFAMLAMGAFSIGWNLFTAARPRGPLAAPGFGSPGFEGSSGAFAAGLFSALALAVVGNWGTVRMIWHGVQRVIPVEGDFHQAGLLTHIGWTFQGLFHMIANPGTRLPYTVSDWYWIPSRALPGWTITEFPAFTFLYGDPHAHMFALPVTVLTLGWALSVLMGRWGWKGWGHLITSFLLGGLVIGALKPTNTWDWPTFLALACVAVGYTALRYGQACCLRIPMLSPQAKRILIAALGVGALAGLSALLYQPFDAWYGAGYNKIVPWDGERSPFWSYMTHWGPFLFVLVSWMVSETLDWKDAAPLSDLAQPGLRYLFFGLGILVLVAGSLALLLLRVEIAWLVLLLMVWAGLLLLRHGLPDAKRAVLFMTGTALFLTLFVEVFRLDGDIDRMNTVFKFYLQAWTLLAVSAGTSLVWLLAGVDLSWRAGWRRAWETALAVIVLGVVLYPVMAGMDKIRDRMSETAPRTLDGMTYMASSTYLANEITMDLSEDYRAIQWMMRSVPGSPVIVEAHTPEYQWGSRFTIYTGLPGVVGWNWHQRQQRAVTPPEWVTDRVEGVGMFYNTVDRTQVERFLQRYQVKYIVVGQLERALYSADGLQKFADWEGSLWREVYHEGQTTIYEVMQ